MDIDLTTRLLRLAHTSDVAEAVSLADGLGSSLSSAHCGVFFPLDWVKGHLDGPALIAAWAVMHCNDASFLEDVARHETRPSVRDALSSSRFVSKETKNALARPVTTEAVDRTPSPESRAKKWLRRKDGPTSGEWNTNLALLSELVGAGITHFSDKNSPSGTKSYVDAFFEAYAERRGSEMLVNVLEWYYTPNSWQARRFAVLAPYLSYDVEACLDLTSRLVRGDSLLALVQKLAHSSTAPTKKITGELMRYVTSSPQVVASYAGIPHTQWLDESGVRVVLSKPSWGRVLTLSLLSDDELDLLLDPLVELQDAERMFALVSSEDDYSRVGYILSRIDDYFMFDIDPSAGLLRFAAGVWASNDQSLVERFCSMLSWQQLFGLIAGEHGAQHSSLVPEEFLVYVITLMVQRCEKDMRTALFNKSMALLGHADKTLQYAFVLHVPKVAAGITPELRLFGDFAGECIHDTLSNTGVELSMALELLYASPDASLSEIASSCVALARAEKR